MLHLTFTTTLLGFGLVILSLTILRIRDFARLRHIPGPSWAGWTDFWMIRAQASGRMNFVLQDVNRRYGKCFKTML